MQENLNQFNKLLKEAKSIQNKNLASFQKEIKNVEDEEKKAILQDMFERAKEGKLTIEKLKEELQNVNL